MHALIFADRLGTELAPLPSAACPALLSLAGKPLLEYTLEDLVLAGIHDAVVVVCRQPGRIRRHFGDGARWGMRLRYLLSRGEEDPLAVSRRLGRSLPRPFLAVRGDVLRSHGCIARLAAVDRPGADETAARIGAVSAGVALIRHPVSMASVAWPAAERGDVDLEDARISTLESPEALHAASLGLAEGAYPGLEAPGLDLGPGLRAGRLPSIAAEAVINGPTVLGDHCRVEAAAQFEDTVVVGHHCLIGRGTRLRRSVVLPGTYVGDGLDVRHAIVDGRVLYRVDTHTALAVDDSALITRMHGARPAVRAGDRTTAALLLALSLPLWPLAAASALASNPRAPLRRRTLHGGLPSWEWASPAPLLRALPRLLAVLRGELRLFGADPAAGAPGAPTGLIHAALLLPADAPEEEVTLQALYLDRARGAQARLQRWSRAARLLCSPRAWRDARCLP